MARNRVNGKLYVGLTSHGVEKRRAWHRNVALRKPKSVFEHAVKKYGIDSFDFTVVQECNSRLLLNQAERWWIACLDTLVHKGYNRDIGGSGGFEWSAESRKKVSERMKGWNPSPETREKLRWAATHKSAATREKLRIASTGKKHSEGVRARLSEKAKLRPVERMKAMSELAKKVVLTSEQIEKKVRTLSDYREAHPHFNRGRKWTPEEHAKKKLRVVSEESRKKMGDSRRGRKHSEETKRKIGEAHKGRKMTTEQVEKMSASRIGKLSGADNPFYGKHHTEESLKKMSESKKGIHPSEESRRKMSETHKKLQSHLRLNRPRESNGKNGQMNLDFG